MPALRRARSTILTLNKKGLVMTIAESELKYGVDEYLQYGQNMGKWLFFRLNSGDFIIQEEGKARRRIKGVPIGTADFEVFRRIPGHLACRVIFLETKSTDGQQQPEQIEFEQKAKQQGAEYYIVRSLGELFEILPMESEA